MIGIKNYKRSCTFDFVSYHVFIISLHDFESNMLTIMFSVGQGFPEGEAFSLLHVAWLSEGKLIVVLEHLVFHSSTYLFILLGCHLWT